MRRGRWQLALATLFGTGYVPWAPGTAGSAVGLALVVALAFAGGPWACAAGALAVIVAGLWTAGPAARTLGVADPGPVVIDEVAGQMIGMLFLSPTPRVLLTAFVLFRLFDVWKPYPVRRLEGLPGSLGIMADDVLAGVLANIAQRALHWGFPVFWATA